jgi:hypothetical protein
LLRESAGDQGELSLATADAQPFALGKVFDPHCRHSPIGHLAIGG